MTNTMKVLAVLVLALACAFGVSAQQSMTQTTLATAVSGPALYSGTSPTISNSVTLATCTGVAGPILPGTPSTIIYIDREAMGVFNVNLASCSMTVNRGYLGTQASPHVSGQMVLIAPNYAVTIAQGGNPVPSGLFQQDAPLGGTCVPTGVTTTPWVNVLTGGQWLCSGFSNTWVAGWNNPYATEWSGPTANVAAAAGVITPSGPVFTITGAGAVTGFSVATGAMIGFNSTAVGYGCFQVIGGVGNTATWTAAGNISIAGTFTPSKQFTFCWSPVVSKFVPSSVA